MRFLSDEARGSLALLGKWLIVAFLGGVFGSIVANSFLFLLETLSSLVARLRLPGFLLPALGAIIVGNALYALEPEASGEGIPSYIRAVNQRGGFLRLRSTLFKYLAALLTLSFRGSGGVVGPTCRVTAGLMSNVSGLLERAGFSKGERRIAAICGVSGTLGSLLHAPLGGGIFAVEILAQSAMSYRDLFPSILASSFSFIISRALGFGPVYKAEAPPQLMEMRYFGWLVAVGVMCGATGVFFVSVYESISSLLRRLKRLKLMTLVGGMACGLISIVTVDVLGAGLDVTGHLFQGRYHKLSLYGLFGEHIALLALTLIILKILATSFTIGSGLSAGFTGPTILLGVLVASIAIHLSGADPGSPAFYSLLAAGISGMLASVMNVPIAGAVISAEILGLSYSFPAAWGSIISFQIAKHRVIYTYSGPRSRTPPIWSAGFEGRA